MVITALIGLPGYYVAVCLMDAWGRRNIQLQVASEDPADGMARMA
jgi:hypothetical protein